MISRAEVILLMLCSFLKLYTKMVSGICPFSFPFDCTSSGAFQGFAFWALGLCLLGKASVKGALLHLLGVSGLLVRIGLTILHQ